MGTFSEEAALSFDFNVMMLGMNAERKAHEDVMNQHSKGVTHTRGDAMSAARRARAVADEIWGIEKKQNG